MLFFIFVFFLTFGTFDHVDGLVTVVTSEEHCDEHRVQLPEGIIGQSGEFNWLGVLNVHLYDGDKYHTAVSGIVFIKIKYALAIAEDVVRIPQRIFKKSRVMFLIAHNTPWYVSPAGYVLHPEYESSNFNNIAIIELDLHGAEEIPLTPICLPDTADTYSSYLTGFTDENQLLEKVIRRITYLDKSVCEEFYNRAGLSSQKSIPTAYFCGYAPSTVTQCVWDNGMAIVSNASGYFNLIALAIYGPGCAAPARFIDLFPYFPWIHSITTPPDPDSDDQQVTDVQQATDVPPDPDDDGIQYIPIHDLFRMKASRRDGETSLESAVGGVFRHEFLSYPFDTEALQHFYVNPTDDPNTISIVPFGDMWENHTNACSMNKTLMYKENFILSTKNLQGVVTYRLSMYDLRQQCSCILLTINCTKRSESSLSFKEVISLQPDPDVHEDLTPDELFKFPPPIKWKPAEESNETSDDETNINDSNLTRYGRRQQPAMDKHMAVQVENPIKTKNVPNYDLYITFEFKEYAVMVFEVYADTYMTTTKKPKKSKKPKWQRKPKKPKTKVKSRKKSSKHQMYKEDDEEIGADQFYEDDGLVQMYEEMQASSLAFVDQVQETMSAGYREDATGLVVMAYCVISACLRKWFFG